MGIETAVQPIILLGMHRSGTAMIARLLDRLGLFQGNELQEDHESVWFLHINDMLLNRVNSAWDNPGSFKCFLANPAAADLATRCLEEDLSSKASREFLGTMRAIKHRSLLAYDQPWGWKDPRTVFTLQLWLRLFPGAKLVYIIRNGVDVAKSLQVRELGELNRRIKEFDGKRASAGRLKLQRAGFKGSSRCLTLEGGFSLWEEYVEESEHVLAEIANERLTFRYEDFVADPVGKLPALAEFCGVTFDAASVKNAIAQVKVNPARANAWHADLEVVRFYEHVRSSRWMTHYGYGG